MRRLTWEEAQALVDRASRPWGWTENLHPSIRPVPSFGYSWSDEHSESARRLVRAVRKAMRDADRQHG